MADAKISALPSASTIAGTEALPVVQSGATRKATVADLGVGITALGTLGSLAVSGNATVGGTLTAALTGNASTATALQTARTINGVAFNGTADINVTAPAGTLSGSTLAAGVTASSLTSVGTLAGLTVTAPITGSVTGSAGSVAAAALTGSTLASGVTASSLTSVGTLGTLTVSGNATFDTDTLFVDAANNRVGVGTASPAYNFQIASAATTEARVQTTSTTGSARWQLENDSISAQFNLYGSAATGNLWGTLSLANLTALFCNHALGIGTNAAQPISLATSGLVRATLDASGNLGLRTTPSAWASTYPAMDIGIGASFVGRTDIAAAWMASNWVQESGGQKYKAAGFATTYLQNVGTHSWWNAPSGSAGAAVTLTQAMTLDASGNLGIGTTPSERLHVAGNVFRHNDATNSNGYTIDVSTTTTRLATLFGGSSFAIRTGAAGTDRLSLDSTGNLALANGYMRVGGASAGAASTTTFGNGTSTTVGATGAAAALPANPLGYIIAHVGTTQVKIPYYTA